MSSELGFPPKEAAHLLIRAELLIHLQRAIKESRLTQVRVAKMLEVSQPRVSDLLRGRIDLFSTDALIEMLVRLGFTVQVAVKSPRRRRE